MCSIIGSFSEKKFFELYDLNSYRGTFSHSYSKIHPQYKTFITKKDFGKLPKFEFDRYCYYLGHSQAPTGGLIKDQDRIHPAQYNNYLLYHNGMLKSTYLLDLQSSLIEDNTWDTYLLLKLIAKRGLSFLSEVDGSFACVLVKDYDEICIFRNEISPLFIDNNLNISSTKFNNSTMLPANKVFILDLEGKKIKEKGIEFKTKNNPYYL